MCHNVVESLAVGTIPIIGYPDWFFPPLEHRKNAIIYSGKEDLMQKVHEVFEMSSDDIADMRKNVIDFYEKYMTAEYFMRRFEASSGKVDTIMLHPRMVCDQKKTRKASVFCVN